MRAGTVAALASCVLCSSAINLVERRDGLAPRVVRNGIQRRSGVDVLQHDRMRKRQVSGNTVNAPLTNEETLYFMDLTIGTPAQKFKMHIDTGSSDLWTNVDSSSLCTENGNPCTTSGTYSANSSSTYRYVNSDFNITYVDGTNSQGDYATDTVRFNGVTLQNQQFGIGYRSSSIEGIVGIGYPINEVAVSFGDQAYANVPANLVKNSYINTNAYSLWLNDLDANTGSILFGGVDTAKYTGSLETVPIIPVGGQVYAEFVIALTGVGSNGNSGSIASNIAVPALLDSGSSLMYLPNDITQSIYDAVNAQYDRNAGAAFVDCSLANTQGTIDFTFSSPTIRVPINELVLVAGVQNNQPVCILGIAPAGASTTVLGDTFLRSAYVVYDLANNEISLAQTDFNSTSTNVLEIQANKPIPSATSVQNAVTSVAQYSDGARIGSGGIGTGGFGGSSSSAGAAVATAAVGYNIALLGLWAWRLWRCR